METKSEPRTILSDKELFIKMAVSAWETHHQRVSKLLESLTDEQLMADTATGRNSGRYLLGHLTAVSDGLMSMFGWGERLYPQLDEVFVKNPDKSGLEMPSLADLKEYWTKVNQAITDHIQKMDAADWFTKHSAISAEDFANEPHRNKLNVLMNRTNHMSSHLGQMIYLTKKKLN